MSNDIIHEDCDCGVPQDCYIVSKFSLKSVFRNSKNNPVVVYKVEDSTRYGTEVLQSSQVNRFQIPFGTIIATNLSSKTDFVLQVEKADGEIESLLVPSSSEAAINITSIVKVAAYTERGCLAGGKFYFDIIQQIE